MDVAGIFAPGFRTPFRPFEAGTVLIFGEGNVTDDGDETVLGVIELGEMGNGIVVSASESAVEITDDELVG